MVTLIGTAEVMKEPAEKVLFVEDMTSADAAKHGTLRHVPPTPSPPLS